MQKKNSVRVLAPVIIVIAFGFVLSVKAQKSEIEKAVGSLGFKVTSKISAAGADWELRDFKMREKTIILVKSKAKVPNEKNMYYRFSIRVEEYGSEADAEKRMKHIDETPPGPTSKMEGPEHDLRVGFRRGKLVYAVGTAVYMFVADGSMVKLRDQLESAIRD